MPALRRLTVITIAGLTLVVSLASPRDAGAQPKFPSRPVRFIVSTTPGATPDLLARMFAPKFSEAWGQPVVVENRPGASGTLAALLAWCKTCGELSIPNQVWEELPEGTQEEMMAEEAANAAHNDKGPIRFADITRLHALGISDFYVYEAPQTAPPATWAAALAPLRTTARLFAHTTLVGWAAAARFTGISRINIRENASNSLVKCVLNPSQGGRTRKT